MNVFVHLFVSFVAPFLIGILGLPFAVAVVTASVSLVMSLRMYTSSRISELDAVGRAYGMPRATDAVVTGAINDVAIGYGAGAALWLLGKILHEPVLIEFFMPLLNG